MNGPGLSPLTPVALRGPRAFRFAINFVSDQVACMRTLHARYGRFVMLEAIWPLPMSTQVMYLAVGPEFNQAVLGAPQLWRPASLTDPGPPNSAQRRLRENLVAMRGWQHTYYRKLLTEPVRRQSVEAMGDTIGELVAAELATWAEGPADLWGLARKLVRRLAIALLFGDDQPRGFALGDLVEAHFAMNGKPAVALCPVPLPGAPYRRLLRNAEAIEKCVLDLAAARRGNKAAGDIVSILVNSPDEHGSPPSDARIAGHIPILFAAAYETCQTALTWTLFLLAQHPPAARALAAELNASLAGAAPTLARVAELPMLNAVIRESMRLLPPVPYQMRTSLLPSKLGKVDIKPGNRVVLSAFLTNRMPERYPEPDRFKPERWFSINPTPFEYLSFSAGPRICPGSWFGLSVVKVALAAIMTRFRVSVVPDTRIDYRIAITMAPRGGLPIELHPADGKWGQVPIRGQVGELVDFAAVG